MTMTVSMQEVRYTAPKMEAAESETEDKVFIGEPVLPPVKKPYKKIYTLPRYHNVNQPQVTSIAQMADAKSSGSGPLRLVSSYTGSRITGVFSDDTNTTGDDEQSVLNHMYACSFRHMKNRNRFVQHVFLVVGFQMIFSFILYLILVCKKDVAQTFAIHMIMLLSIFTTFSMIITIFMICCSNWIRQKPIDLVCLFVITVSVTLQFSALATKFRFTEIFMFISGCLAVICFATAVIASQKKWEAMSLSMFMFIVFLSVVMCGLMTVIMCFVLYTPMGWMCIGLSVFFTLLEIIFMLFIMRKILKDGVLNTSDFVFGAIMLYMSTTTLYIFKILFMFCRPKQATEESPVDYSV